MSQYVAFLRAINVAGHARVAMNDLRGAFAAAGCRNVRTCLQSGNVIFDCPALDPAGMLRRVKSRLRSALGGELGIVLRGCSDIENLLRRSPFEHVEPKTGVKLYVVFLSETPRIQPRLPLVSSKDALEVIGMTGRGVFVVSRRKSNGSFGFPNGFVEQELGVSATSRNWSTIRRIVELVQAKPGA